MILRVHEKVQIEDGLGCSVDEELLYLTVLSYFVDHGPWALGVEVDEALLNEEVQTFTHGHQRQQWKVNKLLLICKGIPFDDVEEEEAIDRQLFSSFFIIFSKQLNYVFFYFFLPHFQPILPQNYSTFFAI